MKLGEVVVPMSTTTSLSFIKIGLKQKRFFRETISVNTWQVEVRTLRSVEILVSE